MTQGSPLAAPTGLSAHPLPILRETAQRVSVSLCDDVSYKPDMSVALQAIAGPASEGIAKAKAEGRYKGRKPTARAKSAEVLRLPWGGTDAHRDRPRGGRRLLLRRTR